jgi:hypothetical protein
VDGITIVIGSDRVVLPEDDARWLADELRPANAIAFPDEYTSAAEHIERQLNRTEGVRELELKPAEHTAVLRVLDWSLSGLSIPLRDLRNALSDQAADGAS